MGYSNAIFEVAAEILVDARDQAGSGNLRDFQDFVIALSIDSGLPRDEVQAVLVAIMLRDGRHFVPDNNVIWLEKLMNV